MEGKIEINWKYFLEKTRHWRGGITAEILLGEDFWYPYSNYSSLPLIARQYYLELVRNAKSRSIKGYGNRDIVVNLQDFFFDLHKHICERYRFIRDNFFTDTYDFSLFLSLPTLNDFDVSWRQAAGCWALQFPSNETYFFSYSSIINEEYVDNKICEALYRSLRDPGKKNLIREKDVMLYIMNLNND